VYHGDFDHLFTMNNLQLKCKYEQEITSKNILNNIPYAQPAISKSYMNIIVTSNRSRRMFMDVTKVIYLHH